MRRIETAIWMAGKNRKVVGRFLGDLYILVLQILGSHLLAGSRGIFAKDGVKRRDEKIRVRLGDDQRRAQLDDVEMRAVGAREYAAIAKAVDDVGRL